MYGTLRMRYFYVYGETVLTSIPFQFSEGLGSSMRGLGRYCYAVFGRQLSNLWRLAGRRVFEIAVNCISQRIMSSWPFILLVVSSEYAGDSKVQQILDRMPSKQ